MNWRSTGNSLLTNDRGKCWAPINNEDIFEANKRQGLDWIMEVFGKG